jgi:hypothetical protein
LVIKKRKQINNTFTHFLNIPELDVSSEGFPYNTFSCSSAAIIGFFRRRSAEALGDTRTEMATPIDTEIEIPTNLILGKQAEYLFEHYLKTSQSIELLAANVQIQGTSRTLGELDYIVNDHIASKTIHVELACKFYLHDPNLSLDFEATWIGPNLKDTLQDKLNKLQEKQFPLLFKTEAESLLSSLQLSAAAIEQRLCLKASLFVPMGFGLETLPQAYQKCIAGRWMSHKAFENKERKGQFAVIPKKKWLSSPEIIEHWNDFKNTQIAVVEEISAKKSPLVYQNINGIISKFFVVWW